MFKRHFFKTFFIRFLAYFAILTGVVMVLLAAEPVIGEEFRYRFNKTFNVQHTLPQQVVTSQGPVASSEAPSNGGGSGFGDLGFSSEDITPVSTDYGIVIEKINANSKVVADVDPANEKQYMDALAHGVAAVKDSTQPGQPGNLYIFSHSVDAPWNIVRYNAVFYLLRELEAGDKIVIFYQNKRYDYIVYDKTIVKPTDVSLLTNRYDKPVLTLQTCDPPGTTLNRLIVRAKLVGS
jgi:LPXTG-site transpeptidase (sortase) family protein